MTELFIYLLKAAIINGVIVGFYYFTLRESNRFRFMRATLLSATILPLIFPLLPFGEISSSGAQLLPAININIAPHSVIKASEYSTTMLDLPPIQELIYYVVAIALLIGMAISIVSIIKKRVKADKYNSTFGDILLEKTVTNPFSFFHWVFISRNQLDHPKLNMLLRHEFSHVKELHSIDRILSGIIRSVLWFSPFSHLTGKYLTQVHEYQADAGVLTAEYSRDEYSDLLLSFYFSSQTTRGITNNFSLHVKKRIIMINNLNAGKIKTRRIVAGLCIAFSFILMTSMVRSEYSIPSVNQSLEKNMSSNIATTNNTELSAVLSTVINNVGSIKLNMQKMIIDTTPPQFPGGDNARVSYILGALKYPDVARKKRTEGTVYVQFTVQPSGKVTNANVIRGVSQELDEAALNVIKGMPEWLPAKAGEKAVAFIFTMPIKFSLDKNDKKGQLKEDTKSDIKSDKKSDIDKHVQIELTEQMVAHEKEMMVQRQIMEQQSEQMEKQQLEMELQKSLLEEQMNEKQAEMDKEQKMLNEKQKELDIKQKELIKQQQSEEKKGKHSNRNAK